MDKKTTVEQLENDLGEAIKTLASAAKDAKSISDAKQQLVLGQQEVKRLVESLDSTVSSLREVEQQLSSLASNFEQADKRVSENGTLVLNAVKKFAQVSESFYGHTNRELRLTRIMIAVGIACTIVNLVVSMQ